MITKLAQLKKEGKINDFLYEQVISRVESLPKHLQEQIIKEAIGMTEAGVVDHESQKEFFYILTHASNLAQELADFKLNNRDLAKISHILFTERKSYPINTIFNFYNAVKNALNKLDLPIKKIAYPQGQSDLSVQYPHDIQKWMKAMQDIYGYCHNYDVEFSAAFEYLTRNWDIMEKNDFKHWMAFYQENAHNKYKTAQYYEAGPGARIPVDHLKAKFPMPDMNNVNSFPMQEDLGKSIDDKKEEVMKKIKSIISRLNAAERLATDPEVQKVLQKALDIGVSKWLEELQRVKRLVQVAPIKSASSPLLEDIIVREANVLESKGFPKAASLMKKLAQEVSPPPVPSADELTPPPPSDVSSEDEELAKGQDAINEFIAGMNNADDSNYAQDEEEVDEFAAITVTAQEMPQASPAGAPAPAPMPAQPVPTNPEQAALEVQEDDGTVLPEENTQTNALNSADVFEAALASVKVSDVVAKLEALANIFRTREISRQLAIIDLMMDRLGIASFFPSLAEANSKTLESNQYALTRIEDILSKLRGTIESPVQDQVQLTSEQAPPAPLPDVNPEALRQSLQHQQEEEKARKEQKKKEQEAAAQPAAQQPVPPELTQPATLQQIPGQPPAAPVG